MRHANCDKSARRHVTAPTWIERRRKKTEPPILLCLSFDDRKAIRDFSPLNVRPAGQPASRKILTVLSVARLRGSLLTVLHLKVHLTKEMMSMAAVKPRRLLPLRVAYNMGHDASRIDMF